MKKNKKKGVNVTVSPKAHEKMVDQGFKSKPKLNLREIINKLNDLPKEE